MDRSNARVLAGGGALLCVLSLLTPWYVLQAGGLTGESKMGAAALGALAVIVVVLAVGAGSSLPGRVHRSLPPLSASALVLVVLVKIASPPSSAGAFTGMTTSDSLQARLAQSFEDAIRAGLGLHYAPAWGIWVAAIGAGLALAGTIATLGTRS